MIEQIEKVIAIEANTFCEAVESGGLPTIGAKYVVASLAANLVRPGLLHVTVTLEIEKAEVSE